MGGSAQQPISCQAVVRGEPWAWTVGPDSMLSLSWQDTSMFVPVIRAEVASVVDAKVQHTVGQPADVGKWVERVLSQ